MYIIFWPRYTLTTKVLVSVHYHTVDLLYSFFPPPTLFPLIIILFSVFTCFFMCFDLICSINLFLYSPYQCIMYSPYHMHSSFSISLVSLSIKSSRSIRGVANGKMSSFLWILSYGLPWWLSSKESAFNAGERGLIPGWGRSPGGGYGNPLQHSCLENPMDRGAWWASP